MLCGEEERRLGADERGDVRQEPFGLVEAVGGAIAVKVVAEAEEHRLDETLGGEQRLVPVAACRATLASVDVCDKVLAVARLSKPSCSATSWS